MRVTAPDKPFLLKVNQWVGAVAFSPDGRWLATPSQYDARLWELNKPDPSIEPFILPGHKYYIADLAFSLMVNGSPRGARITPFGSGTWLTALPRLPFCGATTADT